MALEGLVSVSGFPGLYKVLTQTKTGFIVESLIDSKRQPISATQRISMLEDISIFTITDDIPLKEVFVKMNVFEKDNEIIPSKSDSKKLREFFKQIVPDFDEDRVYISDIKKVISWYNLVKDLIEDEDETTKETPANDSQSDSDSETEHSGHADSDNIDTNTENKSNEGI